MFFDRVGDLERHRELHIRPHVDDFGTIHFKNLNTKIALKHHSDSQVHKILSLSSFYDAN